ncbi:DUF177 domain-containing protein [candidate division FCPU426 bacterium]|nr:DUF177 domain-containing protein [candidate division FCPU426 bacterium]
MLKINVNSLKTDPVESILAFAGELLSLGDEATAEGPVDVKMRIQRMGEKVIARGVAATRVRMRCARCLNDFEREIHCGIFLLALPARPPDVPAARRKREEEKNDAALVYYYGEQLDLLPEIESAFILALPMKPLCREDCPGLCSRCGRRLVDGPCLCRDAGSQGPFAILKKLRK